MTVNMQAIEVMQGDDSYPLRLCDVLGDKAPKFLHMMGNVDLLKKKGVGFCGSRKVTLKGIETAVDCSQQAAKNNVVVISGNAAGVDFSAHYTALASGGETIIVLPEGINNFRIKSDLKEVWDWERVLVISQFNPNEPWAAYRAMARNLVIIALSGAMIVIEAGEKGGTLHAGESTLKLGLPLFVAEYQDMTIDAKGNALLLAAGANKLAKSVSTNKAGMKRVFEAIQTEYVSPHKTQSSLL